MDLEKHKKETRQIQKENQKFFNRLKRIKSKVLDKHIHKLDKKVFSYIQCQDCANCCKTTGPLFTDKDINRIAKHLRIKPSYFSKKYLRIDEENDYVLKSVPCVFLGEDNSCTIYEFRPKACKEFPHTNRNKQHQILKLTQKNVEVCPAVHKIIQCLKQELK